MSAFIASLESHPIVAAAKSRDEKQYFGQGWSHYETSFRQILDGVRYCLWVYNTPNHIQVNWNLRDADTLHDRDNARGWNEVWRLFALTPEESLAFAGEIGLPIADWLDAALAASRNDTTAASMARMGNVVDLPNFHASRAGD